MLIYSNQGFSFRGSWPYEGPDTVLPGEVFFDHPPSDEELLAVFPQYLNAEQRAFEALKLEKRRERDRLLRENYDVGIIMAGRALRAATSQTETDYANGKIVELDAYAVLLLEVPEQAGFPNEVVWPEVPSK